MAKTSPQLFTGASRASQDFAVAVFVAAMALAIQAFSLPGPATAPAFLTGWSGDVATPLAIAVIALLGISPLPLGHKVFLNLASGAAFAVLLTFPTYEALPVAFCGVLLAQLVRWRRGDRLSPSTILFNQVQYVATWSLTAIVFARTHDALGAEPALAWVPVAAAGAVYLLVNTWVVSTWIALRKRAWTLGLWWQRLREGGLAYAASLFLGGMVAGLVAVRPMLVIPLVVGVALLQRVLSHMSRIQQRRDVAALAARVEADERVSPHLHEHSERVAWWAERLARELRLPEDDVEPIWFAGKLHDLGLSLLRAELEAMPDTMLDAQEALVLQHSAAGAEAIARVPGMSRVAAYVRGHHENYDGSGYPDGLRGEDIPLGARIVRVVDAYDSLRSPRLHRFAYDEEGAMARLRARSGTGYDPRLASAFERLVETTRDGPSFINAAGEVAQ